MGKGQALEVVLYSFGEMLFYKYMRISVTWVALIVK